MIRLVKGLATTPDDLSSIPGTHVEGENHFPEAVLWFTHACHGYTFAHTGTHK